jgi:hypothetical protein
MQAMCAVELRLMVMGLWSDTRRKPWAGARQTCTCAKALVLNCSVAPFSTPSRLFIHVNTNNKMAENDEKPVFFFDIDNCVSVK